MKILIKQDVLEKLMEEKSWTMYDLAENMQVSPSTLYRIKNGDRNIGNNLIAKLINVFGLSENDFAKLFCFENELPYDNVAD